MVDYDLIPAVRRSDLWEMRKSPAHYLYKVTHQEEPTPALLFGTAAHKFILEEESFWDQYIMAPEVDRRTKAGKAEWAEFLDSMDGKQPITMDNLEMIKEMDQAIMANSTAVDLLKTGRHEVPIEWTDPETGEQCKCRPDVLTEYLGQKYIVDYKTTTSCEDGAFEYSCRTYGYKLQAGMYTEGVFHAELEDYGFAFVAQEKKAPYSVRVYFCDPGFVEEGRELFHDLIGKLHECKQTNTWPGYEYRGLYADER